MENPDYFCVKCLTDGDEKAFGVLYYKYCRKVYGVVLKITRSDVLAQDITQNVFLKVWDNRSSIDPERNFAAYLMTICKNAIFDMYRKAAHDETIKKEISQFAAIEESPDESDDVYEMYKSLLHEAIQNLSPQRRLIFERCKLQEQSYDVVAKSLGISRSTVQDHIVKANKSIRDYLLRRVSLSSSGIVLLVITAAKISAVIFDLFLSIF